MPKPYAFWRINIERSIVMETNKILTYLKSITENYPADWLNLTTHRLDIYDESRAKTQFIEEFEQLFLTNNSATEDLSNLPTAYDYIRLGHPLSSVLEWGLANLNGLSANQVISFDSKTIPVLAILRKNLFADKKTSVYYQGPKPQELDAQILSEVYGYQLTLVPVENDGAIPESNDTVIYLSQPTQVGVFERNPNVDFYIHNLSEIGSIIYVNKAENNEYIGEIQHVRRRETIAMTPSNCLTVLNHLSAPLNIAKSSNVQADKKAVQEIIKEITNTSVQPIVCSSGLSTQYAIVMGLIHDALDQHPNKKIKIVVPPNCYGGTNDQARRVAACIPQVEVMDLPVDGKNNMVDSLAIVLDTIAAADAIPYIIAEIPTNPRVEVPDMVALRDVLSAKRQTPSGNTAVDPVFILDQTFCPNVHFLGENNMLSTVRTIAYVSGSKFPSGGKCTAGYCVANQMAANLMPKIEKHLLLCDNEATALQYEILAKQMPSMLQRIDDAYKNTREFVNFIQEHLPTAKINFVSEELAAAGFTPSVFSLDLPTKGNSPAEKEKYKRSLNDRLIKMMISEIPTESKYCVSYGQLKGCYWTIPATSTQGTTKEEDKDYIARVALSANMDMAKHKAVFLDFVNQIK